MSSDLLQGLDVEIDSKKLLGQYLRLAIATALEAHEEIAVKTIDREEKELPNLPGIFYGKKKEFAVILIGGWFITKDGKEKSYFDGYKPWVTFHSKGHAGTATDLAIEYINEALKKNQKVWEGQFLKKCGSGYNSGFNQSDGHVGVGYKLQSCNCFPEQLAISLVHIYYGK